MPKTMNIEDVAVTLGGYSTEILMRIPEMNHESKNKLLKMIAGMVLRKNETVLADIFNLEFNVAEEIMRHLISEKEVAQIIYASPFTTEWIGKNEAHMDRSRGLGVDDKGRSFYVSKKEDTYFAHVGKTTYELGPQPSYGDAVDRWMEIARKGEKVPATEILESAHLAYVPLEHEYRIARLIDLERYDVLLERDDKGFNVRLKSEKGIRGKIKTTEKYKVKGVLKREARKVYDRFVERKIRKGYKKIENTQ